MYKRSSKFLVSCTIILVHSGGLCEHRVYEVRALLHVPLCIRLLETGDHVFTNCKSVQHLVSRSYVQYVVERK